MNVLVLNKITWNENESYEKNPLKDNKNIILYKRYSVFLKHYEGLEELNIATAAEPVKNQ